MITGYYISPIFCPYKLSNSKEYWAWKDAVRKKQWQHEVKVAKEKLDRIT